MNVDFHVHVFSPEVRAHRQALLERDATFASLYGNPRATLAAPDDLIAHMDASGFDQAVLVSIGWSDPGLCRESNDYLLDAARRFPTRLIPFCVANPAHGTEAAREVQRCAAQGARGVGELHPDPQGYDLADARVLAPLMEAARDLALPVMTHASEPVGHPYAGKGTATPAVLYPFIQAFPDIDIVCAHWGGGLPFYALMPEVRAALARVWFDTAASPFLYDPSIFDRVPALIGADRVLFGSDYPLITQPRLLRQVMESHLNDKDRARILGGNALELLRRSPRPPGVH